MKKTVLILSSLFLMNYISLNAQNSQDSSITTTLTQDTLQLSVEKAIEIGLSESPTIKIANKEIQRVDYSKKETYAGLFPTVSAVGSYTRTLKKQTMVMDFGGQTTKIQMGTDNNYVGGISASLPIISPTLWKSIQMTELDAELALESARSSKLSLVNEITKAYYSVVLAQDSKNVLQKSYNNLVETAKITENKYKQGTVSEYESIRANVAVLNAKPELIAAESGINLSKLKLKMLMGIDFNTEIELEGNLSDLETNMYSDVLNIDTTLLQKNSDLVQFDIQTKQLEHSLKIQKAAWWPTLSASFNYQYLSLNNDFKFSEYDWNPYSTVGLNLTIPLFQGGKRVYQQKQTNINIEKLDLQRENMLKGLEMQVISYLDDIKKSIQQIESNKEGLKQAEKALNIVRKSYEMGVSTYIDLTNSEVAYKSAGLMYNQSVYNYLSAKTDLEKILGNENK